MVSLGGILSKPVRLCHSLLEPLPNVKGVEGNFYRLLPHKVVTDRNGVRSDFGIHLDANYPGSMGCIVMDQMRFSSFESRLETIAATVKSLPLFVQYS